MSAPTKKTHKFARELLLLVVVGLAVTVLACPSCLAVNWQSLHNLT
ncbi:hypothetical protein BH24BAC1_BH24BAC1_35790 [soil metagenome]